MPFFEQLGKQINDLGQRAVTSTGTFVEVTRLNDSINSIRLQLPIQYRKLGEAYYSLFNDGSGTPKLQSYVDAINTKFAEIAECQDAIKRAKGIEQCQSCGAEVAAGSSFCSNCGVAYLDLELVAEMIQVKLLDRSGNSISGHNLYLYPQATSPTQIVDLEYNPYDGSITATISAVTQEDTIRFIPCPDAPYLNPYYVD